MRDGGIRGWVISLGVYDDDGRIYHVVLIIQ